MFEKAKKVVNNVTIFANQYENLSFITCTINVKFWESCRLDTTEIKKAITGCNSDKID